MTIVEFLTARLAEDEQDAVAATVGPWRHSPDKHWRKPGTTWFEEAVFAGPAGDGATCVAGTGETDDPQSMADARHIARHDPARVLREVEAKRRILDFHSGPHSCGSSDHFNEPIPPALPLWRRVEDIRLRAGWTRSELARRLGMDRGTIDKWKSQPRPPLATTVRAVSDRLGIPLNEALELAGVAVSDEQALIAGPCPTLRAVVSVYANHPDYDESWRL